MMTMQILGLVVVVLAIAMILVVVGKVRMRRELADLNRKVEAFAPTIHKEVGEGHGQQ